MDELEKTFDFDKKSRYDAEEDLTRTRSRRYKRVTHPKTYQLWNRPAPDLRMQLFHPQPVARNSRDAIQPWKYKASFDNEPPSLKRSKTEIKILPSMKEVLFGAEEKEPEIVVSPRMLRPYEAKILFVKEGKYPTGPYKNPKPHDFRGYPPMRSLGLPEFITSYERDPYNIKFKSQNLDQYQGPAMAYRDELPGKQLGDHVLKQPPKWEKQLHLPKEPFPNRSKATTRHRPLYRSPHSAFLERVENKLGDQWNTERRSLNTAPSLVKSTS